MKDISLSIIIPVYNGELLITRCLDSIYSQAIANNLFEVVCINDCSTDNTVYVIDNYKRQKQLENLKVINHSHNTRQGGARNTGVRNAVNDYIIFMDHDDELAQNSLGTILHFLIESSCNLDIISIDYVSVGKGEIRRICNSSNSLHIMDGKSYIKTQQIPWVPWMYIYRREFLLNNNLLFEENVRFEDVDFIIKCTLKAQWIVHVPLVFYTYYSEASCSQTSNVGNDKVKIIDMLKTSERIRTIYENEPDPGAAQVVLDQHSFGFFLISSDICGD